MKTTLEKIYSDFRAHENNAQALLKQTDWFCRIADFDPKTGLALPQALSSVLAKIASPISDKQIHDRLWRIADHCRASVERLFRSLSESPRREQALMPVYAVRELDASSFIKLSNRPGRTIREKLAGKPYLQAVRRFQSVNLPENRLLKAFVTRLAELLELRQDCLGQAEDELLSQIHSWLRSDEANSISNWDNLPPNNTLLSHRDYRRVWDAWRWLQSLDEDINDDFKNLKSRGATMHLWNEYAKMWANGSHLFVDMPVFFDYKNFEVRPWFPQVDSLKVNYKITRKISTEKILTPVCVDLSVLRPRYATEAISQSLSESYLWQQWSNNDESVEIELYNSDAVFLNPDAITISSSDLFFSKDNASECFDRAARAFASRLHNVFKNNTLIWLLPDFLNDFELEIIRRNLNARFPDAEPLPRSVAAIFERVDYSNIKDGFSILVIDAIGGNTCVTKLIANFNPELKNHLPETYGFYWERHPSIIIGSTVTEKIYDIITVDDTGQWYNAKRPLKPPFVDASSLKQDRRIGNFSFCINLTESPVTGGTRLHALQQLAGDIPLWRDHIPELSIKLMKDGVRQRFHLVSHGTTVKPIRGMPVSIPIDEYFTLPAGKPYYSFPLFIGDNANDLGFSARLDSSNFPLKHDVICKLNLTFEYGEDEPYKLVFAPVDISFPPISAKWQRTEEVILTDAPAPEYPVPMTWDELLHFPDSKNGGTMDLISKLSETSTNFSRWIARNEISRIEKSLRGWCRFLVIQIWRDGRSSFEELAIKKAEEEFKSSLKQILAVENKVISDVRFLECCMHKDAPADCVQWITEHIDNGIIREKRAIGFSLGDVSKQWQKDLLFQLVSNPTNDALRVFSYAIWREQHFIEKFSLSELQTILNRLCAMLIQIRQCPSEKNKWTIPNWVRATTEPLELLLGLLRTRASSNPDIKMLLQPHQKITKELAKQVERITEIVAKSNATIFSRVQINVQKPEGDRTPDLLFALRLYLTGDDGANAIHITSVSDSDND